MDISRYILINMLSNWISMRSMCYLDTAFCNILGRKSFLLLLSYPTATVNDPKYPMSIDCFKWIFMRQLLLKELILANLTLTRNFCFCFKNLKALTLQDVFVSCDEFQLLFSKSKQIVDLNLDLCGSKKIFLTDISVLFPELQNVCINVQNFSHEHCDDEIDSLVTNCPKLVSVNLGNGYRISDANLLRLSSITNLKSLILGQKLNRHSFTDAGLTKFVASCFSLKLLEIQCHTSPCPITECLQALSHNCTITTLRFVDFYLSLPALYYMLDNNTTLTSLAWNGEFSSEPLSNFNPINTANLFSKLHTLHMEKVHYMPEDLYKHVSKVTELNLNDCWMDNDEICVVLKAFGGQLKCLYLVCGELARKVKRDIVRYAHGLDRLIVSFQRGKNDEFLRFLNRRMNCRIEQSMLCYGNLR